MDVTETATAVGLTVRTVPHEQEGDGADIACDALGYEREVPVRLAAPLGARVLMGTDGQPIEVTPGR